MSITRPRHKVDANQAEIVDALLAAGYRLQTLATVGNGTPDLLASKGGIMWLLECKMPGEKVSDLQKKWAATWAAPVYVVHDPAEALAAVEKGRDQP